RCELRQFRRLLRPFGSDSSSFGGGFRQPRVPPNCSCQELHNNTHLATQLLPDRPSHIPRPTGRLNPVPPLSVSIFGNRFSSFFFFFFSFFFPATTFYITFPYFILYHIFIYIYSYIYTGSHKYHPL